MFILGRMLPLDVQDLHKIIEHVEIHKLHVINFLVLS
jgi:hypothetical protein